MLLDRLQADLAALNDQALRRVRRTLDTPCGPHATVDGREMLAFCSNDYLGLAGHPQLARALTEGALRWGAGAGASHLVSGHYRVHDELEARLAAFVGMDSALYLSTGYMANLGLMPALLGRGDAALRAFSAMTPDNPAHPPERSWAPPHIIPNGYSAADDDGRHGRMLLYGFSGTFPWLLRNAIEGILGARAEYGGLRVDPCLPSDWPRARIQRAFRGSVFDIQIERRGSGGGRELWVDGVREKGDLLAETRSGRRHVVRCFLGEAANPADGGRAAKGGSR